MHNSGTLYVGFMFVLTITILFIMRDFNQKCLNFMPHISHYDEQCCLLYYIALD